MNTPIDESLHSFLLRQQLIHTHKFDPKGVISADGGWRSEPYAHKEVTHLFEKYDDLFLLEAIDVDIQLGESNHQFFDGPDAYCQSIWSTFFRGEKVSHHSDYSCAILFCPQCIREMIREYGFGYFRRNWGREKWCERHSEPLQSMKSNTYSETLKSISRLFSGQFVSSSKIKSVRPKSGERTERHRGSGLPRLYYPIRTYDCTARAIGKCLAENLEELLKIKFNIDASEIAIWLRNLAYSPSYSTEFFKAKNILGRLMPLLQQLKSLTDFIDDNFSYMRLWVGARNELSEIILVPKEKQYCLCNGKKCEYRVRNAEEVVSVDINYLSEHSTSFQRLAIQQKLLHFTGSHPWSPIRIEDSISLEKLAKATKMNMTKLAGRK